MNTLSRFTLAIALLTASSAYAETSANLGFASEYYYRGIFQAESSASAGIDFQEGGFYAGAWTADVSDGLEVDGYFGYGGEVGDLGYSIGYTGYFYTGDFDDTYQEINLGGSYGPLIFDFASGRYDNFGGPTQDYTYYAMTLERNGFYGKYAGFAEDFDGEYFELGYAATVAGIDLGLTLVFNDSELSGTGSSDEAVIFTIGKTFDGVLQ